MTAALIETTPLYAALGTTYEHELNAHRIYPAMLTHKWQQADLLAPHSDLDIRVLLLNPPEDWWEWNHRLAAAHIRAVAQQLVNRRLLEHPPGFAFTLSEVDRRRVAPAELATWSLISGHPRTFHRWKSQAQMIPWSSSDERFYRGILDTRLAGHYHLAADSVDNVHVDLPGYRRHCVLWHYLAPCWFGITALATRTRCPGKFAALTQWHPAELEPYAKRFCRQARGDMESTVADLLRNAHAALTTAQRHIPTKISRGEPTSELTWTMTVGMLRVRVARWLYYLNPPRDTATGYLIRREARELQSAATALRALAADESTPAQRLAARMADLLPTRPTTDRILGNTLATWQRHHALVEDFLTHDAVPTGGPSCGS